MAWLVACVNVSSFLIAGIGAVALAFRYKRWHWLAIAIAVLMTVMPTIVDPASNGKIPFAPYDEAVPVPPGSDAIKITKTFTPWSYLATAIALLAVVAIRDEKRRANQSPHPTTL